MQTSAARCTSGMTAICWTSGARRRRSMASNASWLIGPSSHVRMDASDGSLIATSVRNSEHKRELWRSLPGDSRCDLRAEARGVLTKRSERLGHRKLFRYDDVHQQVSAVRCRRNVFHE